MSGEWDRRDRERDSSPSGEKPGSESQSLADEIRSNPFRRAQYVRWKARKAANAAKNPEAPVPNTTGAPLPDGVRRRMEPHLGNDLSGVRVHAGSESAAAADQLGARAFTVGNDVHFGAGQFNPNTKEGDKLLAHELTHVVQGQGAGVQRKAETEESASGDADAEEQVSHPGDPAEKEADAVADHVGEKLHGDGAEHGPGDSQHADAPTPAPTAGGGKKISRKPREVALSAPSLGGRKIFRKPRDTKQEPADKGKGKRDIDRKPGAGASEADWVHFLSDLHRFLREQTGAEKDQLLDIREHREAHPVVGSISEAAASIKARESVKVPDEGIWDAVFAQLDKAHALFAGDKPDIEGARREMATAVKLFEDAHRKTFQYRSRTEGGAQIAATTLRGVEIGCDITFTILSAGAGTGVNILKLGARGLFKTIAEQSLMKTAVKVGVGGGISALTQGTAEEGAGAAAGTEDGFDVGKVLRKGGEAAVMNFVGALVGGALSKVFMRTLGEILGARMAPEGLLALAEKYGVQGAIPPELFVSKGWRFLVGVAGDACTTTLMTALSTTVEQLRTGKHPTSEQFVTMVVQQMIQNGLLQVVFSAMTHERVAKPNATSDAAGAAKKASGGEPAHEAHTARSEPAKTESVGGSAAPAQAEPRAYRLRGGTGETLEVKGEHAGEFVPQVGAFLAKELGVEPKDLVVKPLGGGRSGAPVFSVQVHGEDAGVFKVFDEEAAAANEINMLRLLHAKHMEKYKAVGEKGAAPAKKNGGRGGAVLMERATGTSVDEQLKNVPPPGEHGHDEAVVAMETSVKSVAAAMAEMHKAFASGGAETVAQKTSDAGFIRGKFERLKAKMAPADAQAITQKLDGEIIPQFIKSPVPATAYHGDANIGNFVVDKDFNVHVIDVGTMKYSLDEKGHGKSTGAADVGRFMQSLQASSEGKLSAADVARIQRAFLDRYFDIMKVARADFEPGIRLFRAELEMAAMNKANSPDEVDAAVRRLGDLLGVTVSGDRK